MKLNNFHLFGIIVFILLIGGLGFLANEGYQNVTKPKTEFLCRAIPTETPKDVQMAYYAKTNEMSNVHPGLINQPVTEGFVEGLSNAERSTKLGISFKNDSEQDAFWSKYKQSSAQERKEMIKLAKDAGTNGNSYGTSKTDNEKKPFNSIGEYKQWVSDTYCQAADGNNEADDECQLHKDCTAQGQGKCVGCNNVNVCAYGPEVNKIFTEEDPVPEWAREASRNQQIGQHKNQLSNPQVLTKSHALDLKDPVTNKKSTYHCAGVGPNVDTRCLKSSNESLPPVNNERVCQNSLEGQRKKDALTCNNIPEGKEHLYVLKSSIVPPVCPKCPECPASNCPVCDKKKSKEDSKVEDDMENNKLQSEKAMENQKEIRAEPANRGMNQQNTYYSNKSRDYRKESQQKQQRNVYSPNENALSARSNEPMGLLNSMAAIGKNVW
tara:strand:- start:3656 stop:4966 length:1311 start_codon:yes stop_codon:yes gene_type:complete